jgi:glycosyltransferase involved in cell wall biosynthesis
MKSYIKMAAGCGHVGDGLLCAPCYERSLAPGELGGGGRPRRGQVRRPAPILGRTAHRGRVVFRAPVNAFTGYGLHACQIVRDLTRMDFHVAVRPMAVEEEFAPVPAQVRRRFVFQEQPDEWELVLAPPFAPVTRGKRTAYFTMWEGSSLSTRQVELLNEAECVIVPCEWNRQSFGRSGVTRPLHVVPLGIDTGVFQPRPMTMTGPCIFGAAGRLQSGAERKRLDQVIHLFERAFPGIEDVRLHVKAFPDCDLPAPSDHRVRIQRRYLGARQLAQWFSGITCFVSAARAEGWGLMQHQALAVGRPLIAARYGGLAEFFQPEMGYPVEYRLIETTGQFAGHGEWAEPDEEQIVAAMRRVYADREEARTRGAAGAAAVQALSWEASNRALAEVLMDAGMIQPMAPRRRTPAGARAFQPA